MKQSIIFFLLILSMSCYSQLDSVYMYLSKAEYNVVMEARTNPVAALGAGFDMVSSLLGLIKPADARDPIRKSKANKKDFDLYEHVRSEHLAGTIPDDEYKLWINRIIKGVD